MKAVIMGREGFVIYLQRYIFMKVKMKEIV